MSEVLRSEMNGRAIRYILKYCDDAILNKLDLANEIYDMIVSKRPGFLQEVKKLYDGVSQYENDKDRENESVEYDEYYELSEDSDTAKIAGFRNL